MEKWKFETEADEALFRTIQGEELCDYSECADLASDNCHCMVEFNRRLANNGSQAGNE